MMKHKHTKSPIEVSRYLLKNVYLPLVVQYLNSDITARDFDLAYTKAYKECSVPAGTPDDLYFSISNVFMDVDEFWAEFDPTNAEDVGYLNSHKHSLITASELYKRCEKNYKLMQQMLQKYEV